MRKVFYVQNDYINCNFALKILVAKLHPYLCRKCLITCLSFYALRNAQLGPTLTTNVDCAQSWAIWIRAFPKQDGQLQEQWENVTRLNHL